MITYTYFVCLTGPQNKYLANKRHFEAYYIIKLKYRERQATWRKAETSQQINWLDHRDFSSFEIRQHLINILNMHKRTYNYFCFLWRVKTSYVLFKGQNYCLLLSTVAVLSFISLLTKGPEVRRHCQRSPVVLQHLKVDFKTQF